MKPEFSSLEKQIILFSSLIIVYLNNKTYPTDNITGEEGEITIRGMV